MSPHPGGTPKSITVDTTIAAGTVDDNALALLLAAMSLEQGKTFNLNVFSTGEGTTKVVSVKVAAVENVAVPAGTFPAYRLRAFRLGLGEDTASIPSPAKIPF